MRYHHISQHLHANLAGTDTINGSLEQPLQQVFGIADDNLIVGYNSNGKDHDDTLQKVLQICRQVNWKLNRDK